jgi:hypothetical protein
MKEDSKEKMLLNNTPQKQMPFQIDTGAFEDMTEEDLLYVTRI